jgi:hypothetical protein
MTPLLVRWSDLQKQVHESGKTHSEEDLRIPCDAVSLGTEVA